MRLVSVLSLVVVSIPFAACDAPDTGTSLNPEGPPEVMQVFVEEKVPSGTIQVVRTGLAYGTHPQLADEDGTVEAAIASGGQQLRIVLDELLQGQTLEEVACADGNYSRVPADATPDDIDKCGPPNVLECAAVCNAGPGACANGLDPVNCPGILDEDEDGAADDTRMIEYAQGELGVTLTCDGVNIPLDQQMTFWNPSGNQQIPAGPIGVNGLGPAVVLVPTIGLRTGSMCNINFNGAVVDKDGNEVCAPDASGACTPGNTDAVAFPSEALAIAGSDPADGGTMVPVTTGATGAKLILLQFNAAIDPATAATALTLSPAPAQAPQITVQMNDASIVEMSIPGGLAGDTAYTLTIGSALADSFGGGLGADTTLTFNTGAGIPMADAGPDAM